MATWQPGCFLLDTTTQKTSNTPIMSEQHELFYLISTLILVILASGTFFGVCLFLKIYKKMMKTSNNNKNSGDPAAMNYDYWKKEAITADVGFHDENIMSNDNLEVISIRETMTV